MTAIRAQKYRYMKEYTFLFLGNTGFRSAPQREHALAIELANKGYSVIFIEGMPSLGLIIKERLYSFVFNYKTETRDVHLPLKLTVLVPPTVPTFFRSSYTPQMDIRIFSKWFNKEIANIIWQKTIVIATFPYWWYGFFSRKLYPCKYLIYDKCDSLQVASRNMKTLAKMKKAEQNLVKEADLITYSAYTMLDEFSNNSEVQSLCVPNALSEKFVKHTKVFSNSFRTKIGFIGAFDSRWIDLELIKKAVNAFPNHKFTFIAPFRRKFNQSLSKLSNVELCGFVNQNDIPELLSEFKIALIPFLQNPITHVVNPLKLYEYCAAGVPIIAMRTQELEHYSDIIRLANTHDEFVNLLTESLSENDMNIRIKRIKFAEDNTWIKRTDQLLEYIQKHIS